MTRIIGAVVVVRAFGRLLVKDAVRVHAVALRPIVLEEDLDGISHLGMHRRAEQTKMLPLRRSFLQSRKSVVGVFAIDRLAINAADLVLVRFEVHLRILIEGHPHHLVHAHRGIVPINFIYGDVIGAGFSFRSCEGSTTSDQQKDTRRHQYCTILFFH